MRSIDSVISYCTLYQKDLTVLWVRDAALNSSFYDLYNVPESAGISIRVLDCPIGYPENFLVKSSLLEKLAVNSKQWIAQRKLKNVLKGRVLTKELKQIAQEISRIPHANIVLNHELDLLYPTSEMALEMTTEEMDAMFLTKVTNVVLPLFKSSSPSYLSSCYRIHALQDHYDTFIPVATIQEKIKPLITSFTGETVGIHIRGTDHEISRTMSTSDKFINLIDQLLEEKPETNFFLSTDDGESKMKLIEKYGDKILYNEVSSYDRNNSDAGIDAVVDLYCLSKTCKIFGSHHSSFSQTAAYIGGIKQEAIL